MTHPVTDPAPLRTRLAQEGLDPDAWSNGPGDRYAAHAHAYDKVIAVATGSIKFSLPDRGDAIDMNEGDRLELPSGTRHGAIVGALGVTCLEAHLPAGSLPGLGHHPAGSW